ncbi:hypothetical protein ACFQNE_03155 [Gordonia phosphorivorans]|uniref:VWA domain-containing protein n=1 Tax=Gordonia phosphorivorans TaxID=1056982 RepID=A0ABV6H4R9_9ACTN
MTAPTIATGTAAAWMIRSSELTGLVDRLAIRRDLLVKITDRKVAAPGMFEPAKATITLDAAVAVPGIDPGAVTFRTSTDLARYPVLAGILAHETSHADHSFWDTAAGRDWSWIKALEEPRIETVMARLNPQTRLWMQASVAHILGSQAPQNATEAARLLILVGGRLLGGVLDPDPALDLDAVCAPFLTAEQIAVIATATATAVELADGDTAGLQACAAAIVATLTPDTAERGDETGDGAPSDGDGTGGDSDSPASGTAGQGGTATNPQATPGDGASDTASGDAGDPAPGGSGQPTELGHGDCANTSPAATAGSGGQGTGRQADSADDAATALLDALQNAADRAAATMKAAAGLTAPTATAQAKHRAARARARTISAAAADARRRRHNVSFRAPTAAERAARERLRAALRKAADRGVDVSTVAHTTPPGQLNMRGLVHRQAQRATGQTVTATPWTSTRRRRRPQPSLTVAIAADISPSQDHVTDPVGVAAWLLNVLTRDRGGQVETVTWHRTAAQLPIGRGNEIPVATTDGNSRGLPDALHALDGMLHLTATDGARLAVVITDADLPNGDVICGELQRLLDAGVKVLWLLSQPPNNYCRYVTPPAGVTVATITDPNTLADTIAAAAVTALTDR